MNIVLNEKTYIAPVIKSRMVRKALEINEKVDFNNIGTNDLDTLVAYTVEVYGNQFKIDDVYDGLDAEKLVPAVVGCINDIVGAIGGKLGQFPNV